MRRWILGLTLMPLLAGMNARAQTAGIEGAIHYDGNATGTVFVLAVTNLNDFDEEYEWGTPLSGPFTNAYSLTNMEPGIYYVYASMDTNETITPTDPWGHYAFWSQAPIAVTALTGQTTSQIDFELIDGSISNNPYTDNDPEDNVVICDGNPFTCMPPSEGWELETDRRIEDEYFFDSWIVQLEDGSYRLYANSPDQIHSNTPAFDSYHSEDGLIFTNEPGYRFEENGCFMPCVLHLSNNIYRCYYTDQSSRPNCGVGEDCAGRSIKSALSTNGGMDFVTEGDCLVCDTNLPHEFKGVRGARVLALTNGTYRMYYHAIDSNSVWRILSASSSNGLSWIRDAGVRIDPTDYCPESKSVRNFAPIIPYDGKLIHLFITMSQCGEDWDNLQSGLFDSTSTNGLNFTVAEEPIVQNYFIESAYTGNPGEDPQAMPQDPTAIVTSNGMRLYFGIYNGPDVLVNTSGIYSVRCPDWDRDRMDDADELAAGTDPNDASSVLGIVFVGQDTEPGHACIIQWQSATGKTYRLQRASNMVDGFTTDVDTFIPATPTLNVYTDSTATAAGFYYYRIRLD